MARAETHDRIRRIMVGLSGVIQKWDNMIVHGKGEEHDRNLEKVFSSLQEHKINLNLDKCHMGLSEVKWLRMLLLKDGMSKDPKAMNQIRKWRPPQDKSEVKSFLQPIQFCRVFLKSKGRKRYADVTQPLRKLTSKSVKFKWTEGCHKSFEELKELLVSDTVMLYYDRDLPTTV